jgi:hypothetical protein
MNQNAALLSTCLFPPVPWMAAMIQSEETVIDIFETYSKQTYRNRYTILTANGMLDLTVPIIKPQGNRTKTHGVLISAEDQLFRQHYAALESAYGSSPYFEFFCDELAAFFAGTYSSLVELNNASLECVSRILRTPFQFRFSEDFHSPEEVPDSTIDLRFLITPKNKHFLRFESPAYTQVFQDRFAFVPNLSILDLIVNTGLESLLYLRKFPLKKFIHSLQ